MSDVVLLDELIQRVERDGVDSLQRMIGPFLLEIRIEDPTRLRAAPPDDRRTPSSRSTESYPVDDLLELRRVRGVTEVNVYTLRHDATAGRGKDCLIQLGDSSAAVSKQHAKFSWSGDAWTLTDLGSRNGTFVDREALRPNAPKALTPFARIQMGAKRFVFLGMEELIALVAPVRSSSPIPIEGLATELEGMGSRHFLLRHDTPHLLVDVGDKERSDFRPQSAHPLVGKTKLTLGRSSEADIHVPGRAVSKNHAEIFQREGGKSWYLKDAGSSYGTEKNGVRLKEGEASKLVPWDSCSFGSSRVRGLFVDARGLLEFLVEEHKR